MVGCFWSGKERSSALLTGNILRERIPERNLPTWTQNSSLQFRSSTDIRGTSSDKNKRDWESQTMDITKEVLIDEGTNKSPRFVWVERQKYILTNFEEVV